MEKLKINVLDKDYEIFLKNNLLFSLDDVLKDIIGDKNKIFILTDERVSFYYKDLIVKNIKSYDLEFIVLKGYEKAKSMRVYESTLKTLLKKGITRTDVLIAFGGGVIGDLTGFIASTIFRGIDYIMMPSTLLADIDSSIGGKVAINLSNHKNIIGSFYQPKRVLIDPMLLKTLPKREFANGMGELIKYAMIGNKALVEFLKANNNIDESLILECLKIKKSYVEEDPFDKSSRMILNFGHTFGHIIELNSSYLHGESIALGMLVAVKIGIYMKITLEYIYHELESLLKLYNLPTDISILKSINFKNIFYDKKIMDGALNLILLEDIGKPVIKQLTIKELFEVFTWM